MCHEDCPRPVSGGSGVTDEWVEIPAGDQKVPAFVARPEGDAGPGVVIVHDIWGANKFYQDLARRLAGEGFVAVLPDLFVRQGALAEQTRDAARARGGLLDQGVAMTDLTAIVTWLAGTGWTNGEFGTVGFCMGGTLVMLWGSEEAPPAAIVAFYGFPGAEPTALRPRVPLGEANQLRSPLLAIWGDQDAGVGMNTVQAYEAALAEADRSFEIVVYPGPGHAFMTFEPDGQWYAEASDAWARTLSFLKEELAG